ncbi:MAG: ABC transporter substrate-binding protein [Caldilineaceae bacterium]
MSTPSIPPNDAQLPQIVYSKKSYQDKFLGEREKLLQVAFKGQRLVKVEEPLSGYSGAQTWRVSTEKGQVFVVKLAHPTVIEREYQNHQEYVASGLHANAAHPADKPFVSPDGQWALLKSTFVRLRQSRTLLDYIQQKGSVDIATILKDIFREHGHWWWGNAQRKPINCGVYYDRLLPEHLRVYAFEGSDTDALVLKAGELAQDDIAELENSVVTGHKPNIFLQNLRVERIKDKVLTVCADAPENVESPKIRIKLETARPYALGETVSVYAKNLITRRELLNRYARDVLPSFSADSETFIVENTEYPNPIPYLQKLLDKNYDARVATIHGDLNLRNILVDLDENNERYKQHWLIDFALTGEGPVLLDLQWLEVQVITWLLAPAIQKARQSVNVLKEVFEALHSFKELPPQLKAPLQTPYTVLQEIRRLVRDYYLATPNHWDEYYRGLVIALLGSMRHEEALDLPARQVAFLSAAAIIRWTEVLPSGLDRLPTSRFSGRTPANDGRLADLKAESSPTKPLAIPDEFVLGSQSGKKQARRFPWPVLIGGIVVLLGGLLGGLVFMRWPSGPATPTATPQTRQPGLEPPVQQSAAITIGVALDLNDRESLIGIDQANAAMLAQTFFKDALTGLTLKLDIQDAGNKPEKAANVFTSMINHNAVALIGPTLSSQATFADKIPEDKHVPVIGPSNTADNIPDLGCYVSRISAPAAQLAPVALTAAYQISPTIKNVALVYLNAPGFTQSEAASFAHHIATATYGFRLGITQTYPISETEFITQVQNILNAKPDLTIIAGLPKDGGTLVNKLREAHYTGAIIGGNGFNTQEIFNVCRAACNDVIVAQAYSSAALTVGNNQAFVEAYQKQYHTEPSPIAAQMFTAVQVIVEALAVLHKTEPLATLELPNLRTKLNQTLLSGMVFKNTPLGEVAFAPNGEVIQHKYYVARLKFNPTSKQGRFETLDKAYQHDPSDIEKLRTVASGCQ